MLILNHYSQCICKAFGTDCTQVFIIEQECREILRRADTTSEAIELVYGLSNDEKMRTLYLVTLGRVIEIMGKEQVHEKKS